MITLIPTMMGFEKMVFLSFHNMAIFEVFLLLNFKGVCWTAMWFSPKTPRFRMAK